MADAALRVDQAPGWLKNAQFDGGFIVGIAALALLSAGIVVAYPPLFPFILLLDLWLLGYHHVISTYTRLCFDKASFQQHKFLVLYLPLIVFGATFAIAAGVGLWALASIYLYWQWFHYTRQSWGVSQMYRRKAGEVAINEPDRFAQGAFYALPIWAILHRSHQDPGVFLGLELRVVPVPELVVQAVAVIALGTLALWAASRIRLWLRGELPVAYTLYWLSHMAVFGTGYLLIEDITYGWLAINVWHNLQYIVFVWLFNTKRFEKGETRAAPYLSRLSQPGQWKRYMLVCLGLSSLAYGVIEITGNQLGLIAIPMIVIYQAINFHHYIVDGVIWKSKKNKVQRELSRSEAV